MACVSGWDALKPVGNLVAHRAFSVRFITAAVIVDHIILWLIGSSYTETNTYTCDLNFLLLMGTALIHCACSSRTYKQLVSLAVQCVSIPIYAIF